ncbi:MAG: transposase [Alphaproteobacteria bacterium]|jgi:putative transposase|nr:transposase [Alphaproteobacteria bacterium]
MGRFPRYNLPGVPQHLIQRGVNRAPVFFDDDDRRHYLDCLAETGPRFGLAVHAYVLMGNHVHLLLTPAAADSLPRGLQSLNRRHVGRVNRRHGRSGTLWEGRYRATVIDSERYLLACMRYIDLNPVRAGLAAVPRDYPWSSYRHLGHGEPSLIVTPHLLYEALGGSASERRRAYRRLVRQALEPGLVATLRQATNAGWALGDDVFQERVARRTGHRVTPLPRGRRPSDSPAKSR